MSSRRWSLSALSLQGAAGPLQSELRNRMRLLLTQLTAAPLPLKLHPVRAQLVDSYRVAVEHTDTSVLLALEEVERCTANAVSSLRELPRAQDDHSVQSLLQWGFSELLSHRVLAQRHAELAADPSGESRMLEAGLPVGALIEHTVEDARAFCREKFGDSPEVVVRQLGAGSAVLPLGLPAYVRFPLHELLKNAMGSHTRLVGADRLDELPPVVVSYSVHGGWASIEVSDSGGGWASVSLPNVCNGTWRAGCSL